MIRKPASDEKNIDAISEFETWYEIGLLAGMKQKRSVPYQATQSSPVGTALEAIH